MLCAVSPSAARALHLRQVPLAPPQVLRHRAHQRQLPSLPGASRLHGQLCHPVARDVDVHWRLYRDVLHLSTGLRPAELYWPLQLRGGAAPTVPAHAMAQVPHLYLILPFATPFEGAHQLLPVHAAVRLHVRHSGQKLRHAVRGGLDRPRSESA
eukprot:scaffold4868_cov416-Prasinococcus_capsulatus_cf.AAC.2